ncbi:Olfactory receptor 14C36 [Sciurus carolinensis]|uniref:Olfactory receptor 14C36 n=1 Tax=Sciurus carolinensis TaxID=30640 RepID=A0AA41N4J5_SCICA|nr:Olfactory receptor 14C36 [Sciurus carolinensis]
MMMNFLPPDGILWCAEPAGLTFYILLSDLLAIVMGNILIIVITTDKNLHTPMYFFLRNLSILDACHISVTVPMSCMNSLLGSSGIFKTGSTAQIFLVVFSVYMELLFSHCHGLGLRHSHLPAPPLPDGQEPSAYIWMTLASLLSCLDPTTTPNTPDLQDPCQTNRVPSQGNPADHIHR